MFNLDEVFYRQKRPIFWNPRGVRGDANGVLASRPRFCRRMRSWTEGIEAWTADPRADRGVVMTGLMADSVGIADGVPTAPAHLGVSDHALRTQTVAAVGRSYTARQCLLQDATTLRAGFPSRLRMFTTAGETRLTSAA